MTTTRFITRPDGSTIAYTVQGPEGASAIVLSNSLATDHTMWAPVLPALSARHRVICYDTRGHGQSRSATATASLADLADDVLAVMDAAQVARACVVGVSLGGMTGLTLALSHPERLSGLMACNCRARMGPETQAGWEQRIAAVHAQGMAGLADATLERWFAPDFRAAQPELMAKVRAMVTSTTPLGYEACVRAIQGLDLRDRLGEIRVPALYVAGAQDEAAAPASEMQAMAALTPGARCEVLDPCGHITPLQRPDAFAPLILGFCATLK